MENLLANPAGCQELDPRCESASRDPFATTESSNSLKSGNQAIAAITVLATVATTLQNLC